ncbi:MAG: branched-chain amino acid ABC transporter permease [Dehalococcoidia bacterium]|nr:branched-chain amino acid ABC transporter permease [Dehalococcoidia bacterium]
MSLPAGTCNETLDQDMAIVRTRLQWGILIVSLLVLFAMPLYLGNLALNFVNYLGISIIAALGLNILTGLCGQFSVGHAAFMMVGAYVSTWCTVHFGIPYWIGLPIAALTAGGIGMIFGAPSLRVKGFYLIMATMAAQFIIPWLIKNVQPEWTGGNFPMAVPVPTIGDIKIRTELQWFYIIIPMTVLGIFLAKNLARTRMGRAFIAIRDNDLAAEVMGINTFKYKVIAFFISSVYAGVAGSLMATWMRTVSYTYFEFDVSIWYLGMVVVGGLGSTFGAVAGAIFIRGLDYVIPIMIQGLSQVLPMLNLDTDVGAAAKPVLFGLVLLLFILFEPRGIAHRWEIFKAYYRLWPFSY